MKIKKIGLLIPTIILLLVYYSSHILYNPEYVRYIKPFIIPSFMVYVLATNYKKLTINYILFVLFFYISGILLFEENLILFRIGLISTSFTYLLLINLSNRFIKSKKDLIPNDYTLAVLVFNAFLIGYILYILVTEIDDLFLNIILCINAFAIILLMIGAVTYLSRNTNRKSKFYFFGVMTIITSDILLVLVAYKIDSFELNQVQRVLHYLGFFLIYWFVSCDFNRIELKKESL